MSTVAAMLPKVQDGNTVHLVLLTLSNDFVFVSYDFASSYITKVHTLADAPFHHTFIALHSS